MRSLRQNPLMVPQDGAIVMSEANSGYPLKGDFERMARRRFQAPSPFREGNWWWIKIWMDEFRGGKSQRIRKRLKVAPATTGAREAQKIASEMIRPMNQGLESAGSATPFGTYIDTIYRPTVLPLLASSTRTNYEGILNKRLLPLFGDMALRDLSTITLQKYFSSLQAGHASAMKIKDALASVLGSAVSNVGAQSVGDGPDPDSANGQAHQANHDPLAVRAPRGSYGRALRDNGVRLRVERPARKRTDRAQMGRCP
jgi:hypothetical protein